MVGQGIAFIACHGPAPLSGLLCKPGKGLFGSLAPCKVVGMLIAKVSQTVQGIAGHPALCCCAKHVNSCRSYGKGACALGYQGNLSAGFGSQQGGKHAGKAGTYNDSVAGPGGDGRSLAASAIFGLRLCLKGGSGRNVFPAVKDRGIHHPCQFHFPGKLSPEGSPCALPALGHKVAHVLKGIAKDYAVLHQGRGGTQAAEGSLACAHAKPGP